jgi:hypothetical protein
MKFEENAEVGFEEWFTGNYGNFSCRSEWFYGDCEVKDEKIRKDLVYNWVRAAFLSGYEMGGAQNIAKDYLKIFPEAKNDIDMSVFSDYVVGQPK